MTIIYIDPGTGSMLISAFIALLSVVFFMLKGFIYRTFNLSSEKGDIKDLNKKYGLVFYSEGKQYWNVFASVIEECSTRGIKATYMTSDKEDPGLKCEFDGIETLYIGKGRESYYFLNRLHADMVIMTTPGLDVLEIKRSKNVKHYCHLLHSMTSITGYKSYSVDYFDSVLLGGDLDVEVIRGLEALRGLKEKEIHVVGHTYVDVLRDTLKKRNYKYDYFEEKRPTILLSPTWGNHGLLMNYGEELLEALEKENKYNVIVRPHPQTFISEKEMIENLMNKFPTNENLVWDLERENLKAMSHADIMISDFSGIIYDFYALFNKPILTINSQYERRGRDASDVAGTLWEIEALDFLGKTVEKSELANIVDIIDFTLDKYETNLISSDEIMKRIDKYPGESSKRSVDFIEEKLKQIKSNIETAYDVPSGKFAIDATLKFREPLSIKESIKSWFHPRAIVQYLMTISLFIGYIYLGIEATPKEGLNYEFFTRLLSLTIQLGIVVSVIFLLSVFVLKNKSFEYFKTPEKINKSDFLLILLPLTPIMQYILANQDILNTYNSIYVFAYFTFLSIIAIVIVPWLLSVLVSKSLTTAISLSFVFIFMNMSDFGRTTRPLYIGIILILIFILAFLLLYFNKKSVLVIMVSVLFIANFSMGAINLNKEKSLTNSNEVLDGSQFSHLFEDLEPKNKTNIYLMVYDAYPNEETMKQYDYDNSYQYNYLLDNGFAIYDGTYSLGAASIVSMASVVSIQDYDTTEQKREMLAGEAFSYKLLRNIGYQTEYLTISDYMTKGAESTHNYIFPSSKDSIDPHKIIINAIKEGEFRFDLDFSSVTYADYVNAKKHRLSTKVDQPRIYHAHDDNPGHSQNSGVLLPNETELFIERLEVANQEMKSNISEIRLQDENAIIVILGDHGPYLTKNGIGLYDYDIDEIDRLDIQDRFGTFLAISWPDKEAVKQYNIEVIQDVMPAILSYIYDDASLYEQLIMKREIFSPGVIGGVNIIDGKLYGGKFDGEDLFEIKGIRVK